MSTQKGLDIPISILELATINQGQSLQQIFENCRDLAIHAEEWGYHRFWLAEHHNMESVGSSATSVLIGYIAAATSKIRVGSGGIMLPNHSPLAIAEQFGTLGTLYPNRIDLGLGRAPGTDPLTAQALRREPFTSNVFPDLLKELTTYFSPLNAKGRVRAIPGEGVNVPFWILGSSTDSAHLAANKGLPYVFASHFAPTHLFKALSNYRVLFIPSEHLTKPKTMACVNIIAADTDEEAEYLSTSFLQLAVNIISGNRQPLQPPVAKPEWSEYEQMALSQMLEYSFIGSEKMIKHKLEQFVRQTEIDELMVISHIYDHKARLKSFEITSRIMGKNSGKN